MASKLNVNSLTNFITKGLDTRVWAVWRACPDASLYRFLIVLKALKPTELYNELINDEYFINKDEFVCGLVDPNIECMRVILHTKDINIVNELTTMKFFSISHYEVYSGTQIVRSYIPERNVAKRMHKVEQDVLSLKKELCDEIEWHTASNTSELSSSSHSSSLFGTPPSILSELSSSPVPFYKKLF